MKKLLLITLLATAFCSLKSGNTPRTKIVNAGDIFGTRVFIENKGQYDNQLNSSDKILYVLENGLEKIYFTDKGLIYALSKVNPLTEKQREDIEKGKPNAVKPDEIHYVNMNWMNSNQNLQVERSDMQNHYFTFGEREYNSRAYKKITYKNVYNHIDIEYTIPKDKAYGVKYNVILHPGANPNEIVIAYSGEAGKMKMDNDGNIIIRTPLEDIIEHAPESFYSGAGGKVRSSFAIHKNKIGFDFPDGFNSTKTLIIDPWVTSISTLSSNNYAYDVDYDFSGNTYIYGGYNPFKVARYSSAGVLQWTFAGNVPSQTWSTAPITSQASNFAVNKYDGKTYIGQGYVNNGNRVIRLDALGNYDNFINTANNQFQEVWDMGFHCDTTGVFVLGGGTSSNISAVTINPTTAVINLTTFQPASSAIAQDVVCHAIDDAGKIFVICAGAAVVNNKITLVNPAFNNNIWTQPSTFNSFSEQGNKSQYQGVTLSSNGYNCLAVNANFVYYYDGFNLSAYNKTTGALVGSTTIPALTLKRQGGIAVDDCDNLYVGGNGSILGYHFNGTTFNAITNIPLNVTTTNQYVYDLKLDKISKILYVSGSGFVGTFSPVNSLTCPTATTACFSMQQQDFIICAGQSVTLSIANTATLTNPSYSLQPGGTVNTTGSFVVTPAATTIYTLFITGNNQASASVTHSGVSTVSVFPQPVVAPTLTQTSCTSTVNAFNLNLTFNPPGPAPSYTISWSTIPTGIFNNTQTSATGGILPGVYEATVTTAWGCYAIAAFTINPIPEPADFIVTPPGGNYVATCFNPTINLSYIPASFTYSSSNGVVAPIFGANPSFSGNNAFGTWTAVAVNPVSGCVSSQTYIVSTSTNAPSAQLTPTLQNITCSVTSVVTVTAYATPTVNITHHWLAPQGGTLSANSATAIFLPGGPGTYTHCILNDVNGCSTCRTFTVSSTDGFPTYTLSSPQNFTLGCSTKSVATINILNGQTTPSGGPVSYTIIGPPTSPSVPSGTLSTISNYTVSVPGTWTVITKDNTNFCETRVQVSVLQNTFGPHVSAIVPQQILTCDIPTVTLFGLSNTPNVSYEWTFPTAPGSLNGNTIIIGSNSATPNSTNIATYTLTVTDINNTCKTPSLIPMYQNLFRPNAVISGNNQISCNTVSVTLTNSSSSNIPPIFNSNMPVIGYLWEGPTPQTPIQLSSTYVAFMPGTYSMTVKDLNNGCMAVATKTIDDFRDYPFVNKPIAPAPFVLDCGSPNVKIWPILSVTTTAGYTYLWETVPTSTVSGVNTPTLTTNTLGRYEVFVTNNLNGCMSSGIVEVIDGKLNGGFVAEPMTGFAPMAVSFTNTSNSTLGTANIKSAWNLANGNTYTSSSVSDVPSTIYTQPGTYSVTLFVNKGTCYDTVVQVIKVEIPSLLEVPNIFTPNDDGINDVYFLKTSNLEQISMVIYDRWGHKVYELLSNTGNIAWDGKNQTGKNAAEGVYNYILTAKGKDGKEFKKNGTITLAR